MQNHGAKTEGGVGSGSTDWRSESPQVLSLALSPLSTVTSISKGTSSLATTALAPPSSPMTMAMLFPIPPNSGGVNGLVAVGARPCPLELEMNRDCNTGIDHVLIRGGTRGDHCWSLGRPRVGLLTFNTSASSTQPPRVYDIYSVHRST